MQLGNVGFLSGFVTESFLAKAFIRFAEVETSERSRSVEGRLRRTNTRAFKTSILDWTEG